MKKIFLLLMSIITLQTVQAQNEEYRSVVSASAGISLTGAFVKAIETGIDIGTDGVSIKSIPVLQLTYDYGINQLFSLGVAVGYQSFGFDINDYSYTNEMGNTVTESFTSNFSRLNVALRPLIHYANTENLDLYSGARVGFLNNVLKSNSTDDDIDLGIDSAGRFSFGLTAFGIRYYFTDNIGAGIEINIGAPYISCFNLNARF